MNKLQELHYNAIKSNVFVDETIYDSDPISGINSASLKTAELTEQIACDFIEWKTKNFFFTTTDGWGSNSKTYSNKNFSSKQLFQEFIKTLEL